MSFLRKVLLLLTALTLPNLSQSSRSILDVIRENDDFSTFRSLLFRYDATRLLQGNVTVFVPINEAFENYRGPLDEKILLNHIVNWTVLLEELDSRTRIVTQESYPTLWVTRGRDFLFVNGAKIDVERSNYVAVAKTSSEDGINLTVQVILKVYCLFFY